MRPGKAGGNYPLERLFVHECGCMAAPANRAGTGKIRPNLQDNLQDNLRDKRPDME
jgi:hypothetical protein